MRLIAEKMGPREKHDHLRFVRDDGTETHCPMPRQGTLPHDLIHFVVESTMPFKHGFLSLVAAGADAAFVMNMVHDATNLEILAEAVQVESIVEAMQSQLWAGEFDAASFLEAARLAAESRGKPPFEFSDQSPESLYLETLRVFEEWTAVPIRGKLELRFKSGQASLSPASVS